MTVESYYNTLNDNEGKLNEFKTDLENIFKNTEVTNILFNIKSYKHVADEHVADSYYHYRNVLTQEAKTKLTNYFPKKDYIPKDVLSNYQKCLSDACCYIAWTIIANKLDSKKNQITGYYDSYFYDEEINTAIENGKLNFSKQNIDINQVIQESFHNSSDAYEKYLVGKPGNGVEVTPSATGLTKILSCSDFITVYNSNDNNQSKQKLANLLNKYEDFNYRTIKESVDSSSLSPENKKMVFAKVLPAYDFKLCNDFNHTLNMFKDGYIDFDTLVTKFWTRDDFDKDQNNTDQQNAFQTFAGKYKSYADYQNNDISSLKSSTKNMIDALRDKGAIGDQAVSDLKDQINDATNVTIVGVIIQFFSNLFSKGKTAFKPIQQTKQDRVISNLKPLSGILRQAAGRNKEGNDKLI